MAVLLGVDHRAVNDDLVAVPVEAQFVRPSGDERLFVLDARAVLADVEQADGAVLHLSRDGRLEEQALDAAAFLVDHAEPGF